MRTYRAYTFPAAFPAGKTHIVNNLLTLQWDLRPIFSWAFTFPKINGGVARFSDDGAESSRRFSNRVFCARFARRNSPNSRALHASGEAHHSCEKFAPEFLCKICAQNSCAKFAPRILHAPGSKALATGGCNPLLPQGEENQNKFFEIVLVENSRSEFSQELSRRIRLNNSC